MKRKLIFYVAAVLIAAGGIYAGGKIYKTVKRIHVASKTITNITQAELSAQSRAFAVQTPLRVVCLGNSITKHRPAPKFDWHSDWGMAATTEQNDYCHVLQSKLQEYTPPRRWCLLVSPISSATPHATSTHCLAMFATVPT